ncbi:MAG: pseudouridine synthase [Candidatus Woesearchaeota archaeon]
MQERVQKLLSSAGIASRRECEELIKKGVVSVNGKTITIGDKASRSDTILVHDKPISFPKFKYYAHYKPKWYVTTLKDEFAAKKINDLFPQELKNTRIYPIGRLDKDAEGLILLTNDGEFANKVMHPRFEMTKTYRATLDEKLKKSDIAKMHQGIELDDGPVTNISIGNVRNNECEITIHVGRHKIVKRIFKHFGYRVHRLVRVKIGSIHVNKLRPGEFRELKETEISALKEISKKPLPKLVKRSDFKSKEAKAKSFSIDKKFRKSETCETTTHKTRSKSQNSPRSNRFESRNDNSQDKSSSRRNFVSKPRDVTADRPKRRYERKDTYDSKQPGFKRDDSKSSFVKREYTSKPKDSKDKFKGKTGYVRKKDSPIPKETSFAEYKQNRDQKRNSKSFNQKSNYSKKQSYKKHTQKN